MCESGTPFNIEFMRRINAWVSETRIPPKCDFRFSELDDLPDGLYPLFTPQLEQTFNSNHCWGYGGFDYITEGAGKYMRRLIEYIDAKYETCYYGQVIEPDSNGRFWIAVSDKDDTMILKLSV